MSPRLARTRLVKVRGERRWTAVPAYAQRACLESRGAGGTLPRGPARARPVKGPGAGFLGPVSGGVGRSARPAGFGVRDRAARRRERSPRGAPGSLRRRKSGSGRRFSGQPSEEPQEGGSVAADAGRTAASGACARGRDVQNVGPGVARSQPETLGSGQAEVDGLRGTPSGAAVLRANVGRSRKWPRSGRGKWPIHGLEAVSGHSNEP